MTALSHSSNIHRLTAENLRRFEAARHDQLQNWRQTPQNFERISLGINTGRKAPEEMKGGDRRKYEEFAKQVDSSKGKAKENEGRRQGESSRSNGDKRKGTGRTT